VATRALTLALLLCLSTGLARAQNSDISHSSTLVIIIDDLGHRKKLGRQAIDLPGRVTMAVLPHTPFGTELAQRAHQAGREVMLHAPMSDVGDSPLGPGGLTMLQSQQEFSDSLESALTEVPHVRGVNNHMGSELTQQGKQMAWLMQILRKHQLYFVDSRTSPHTVAAATAQAVGIPHLSRNVFLDNELNSEAIHERFEYALQLAQQQGLAVAIGHPHPETLAYLKTVIPELDQRGIKLRYVSEVLNPQLTAAYVSDPEVPTKALQDQSRTSIPRSAM
jgi:polysaccharide deacetylase 2 family uncharacterized protein YibQ